MTTLRDAPQRHFEERDLYDPALLMAVADVIHTRDAVRRNRKAKKTIKKAIQNLEPGMYRVGEYLLTVDTMEGGDIHIDPWVTKVANVA